MKRKLLIAAGAFLGLFLLGVAALFILVDPDDIKNQALARARETTGYSIEAGPASLKLGFSGAGVRLQDVFLQSPDTLQTIRADHVDVLVKILPLLGRKVELSRVAVGGAVYERNGPWGRVVLNGVELSGGFTWNPATGGAGEIRGEISGGSFRGETGELPIPAAKVRARFEMSASRDRFILSEVALDSGALHGSFSGEYVQTGEAGEAGGTREAGEAGEGRETGEAREDEKARQAGKAGAWEGEFRGSLDPVEWVDVVFLLPPETLEALGEAEIRGTLAVPEIAMRTENGVTRTSGVLTFSDVSVKVPSAPLGLSEASGTIRFTPEKVSLEDGRGKLGDNPVKLTGSLSGVENKVAEFHVDTRIDGATLGRLLPEDAGLALEKGSVSMDLEASGPFPFTAVPRLNGTVSLDGLEGTYRGLPLRNTGGTIRFKGKEARIENLRASLGRSDFSLSGTAPDISDPWFRFSLESNVLDVNELFPEETGEKAQDAEGGMAIGLPGVGTVRIGTLHVRKLSLQDIRGDVRMALDGVDLTNLRGRAYGGDVSGGLAMRPAEIPGTWRYEGGFKLSQVGIGEFLLGWSDLGRILEGGLNGTLTLNGLAGAGIDARSAFNLDGDFGMRNGTLRNLPVLLSIAQALGLSGVDQERWPFKSIDADITVRDGKAVLKTLQLKQPGLDWSLEGSVSMDGGLTLDGTVRADPSRVNFVGKEIAAHFLAEPDGRIPVPFSVGGTLKSPRVTVNQAALERRVAEKAKHDVNREVKKLLDGVIPDSTLKKLPLGKIFGGKGGG